MPTIVHFDIPVDDLERARKFYTELFGWKIQKVQEDMPYLFIETTDAEGKKSLVGGMGEREFPEQRITNFIGVPSIEEYLTKIDELGGKVLPGKTPVPGWGFLAICIDPEGNSFGLWEDDSCARP